MKKISTTDENIINEYYGLCTELGTTQKCYDAVLNLSENKQEPWKSILVGLAYELEGNGIKMTDKQYENTEGYKKAYTVFNKIQKEIKDKEGLLFLFVEVHRITALALCLTKPIKQIEYLYDNIINKFKDKTEPAIQTQVATAMLDKSFVLWKYSKLANENGFDEMQSNLFQKSTDEAYELVNIFRDSKYEDNININEILAKTRKNIANDMAALSDKYKEKSRKEVEAIIKDYERSDDDKLRIQVSNALFSKALDLHEAKVIEDAKEKNEMSFSTEPLANQEDSFKKAIKAYNDVVEHADKGSNGYEIQRNVLLAMEQKAKMYRLENKFEELIALYNEIIEKFDQSEDEFFTWSVIFAMLSKVKILREMSKLEEALKQCDLFIKRFSDNEVAITGSGIKQLKADLEKEHKKQYEESIINKRTREKRDRNRKRIEELNAFYPNNEENLRRLVEGISEGHIIPFIGAGLSHFKVDGKYIYPLWWQFVDDVYQRYRDFKPGDSRKRLSENIVPPFEKKNCIEKASFLEEQLGQAIFGSEVQEIFKHKRISEVKNTLKRQPHTLLPVLFTNRLILTTNFDNLIELIYQDNEKLLSACSDGDSLKMDDINKNVTMLYKLHGTIDRPNSIILTNEKYKNHYGSENPDNHDIPLTEHGRILNKFLTGNSVLFMGCSMEEDDELMLFYKKSTNFAIFPCTENNREKVEKRLSGKNILPILFPIPELNTDEKDFPDGSFDFINDILEYCLFEVRKKRYLDLRKIMDDTDISSLEEIYSTEYKFEQTASSNSDAQTTVTFGNVTFSSTQEDGYRIDEEVASDDNP